MKVIVSEAISAGWSKHLDKQQSHEQEHVVLEVMQGVNYVLVEWLQAQGFKLTP